MPQKRGPLFSNVPTKLYKNNTEVNDTPEY